MTSFIWRETKQAHLCTWGNAYSEMIKPVGRGSTWRFEPRHPSMVKPKDVGDRIDYVIGPYGHERTVPGDRIIHIPGLGFDGIQGFSPIRMAKEAIGLGMAAEAFGAKFFGNGANAGGVLEHPEQLSDDAFSHLKESFDEQHTGIENAHKPLILEEGMKWTQLTIPPEDAQFLETRQFQVAEIARIFNLPPHKLRDLSKSSFNNIEQESIDFVVTSIRPWLVRWEQELYRKLFVPMGDEDYFAEFLVDGLLRGDLQSRYRAYATARQWGWMSADDIRRLENMNALPDGQGKIYLIPMNMTPADQAGQKPPKEGVKSPQLPPARAEHIRDQLDATFFDLFEAACRNVVKREINAGRRALRKVSEGEGMAGFRAWQDGFYERNVEVLNAAISPAVDAYHREKALHGLPDVEKLGQSAAMSAVLSGDSHRKLVEITSDHASNGEIEALTAQFDSWEAGKSTEMAMKLLAMLNPGDAHALRE
jgi:HK97 family phage portal protein